MYSCYPVSCPDSLNNFPPSRLSDVLSPLLTTSPPPSWFNILPPLQPAAFHPLAPSSISIIEKASRVELIMKTIAPGSDRPAEESSKLSLNYDKVRVRGAGVLLGYSAEDGGILDVTVMTARTQTHPYLGDDVGFI